MKLAFIGGGNMANALIAGLHQKSFDTGNITVIEPDADKRISLSTHHGVVTSPTLADAAISDVIVLAIKPQQMAEVCKALAPYLKNQLIISIAAGIRIKDLSRWLGNYKLIIRAMPNTPAQIQAGITGLHAMPDVSTSQTLAADEVLSAAGTTIWLSEETLLDAVTAISGSGPAYVFYFIEALQQAAMTLGLTDEAAKRLSIATFKGASLLADGVATPVDILRAQVTSKGGTTEQGILSLEKHHVKQAIADAAQKAYERAKTLGDELGGAE
ncbi:MAG TPA: pyrroline-5-carboxylate reductase [Methylophilus sp.]|nr:pyrroline-5-carboxylate reductase [Methylophilus sp.]HQQ33083.1 pyrroline-5-carboxylate reductase [Methylophilus sp.]